MLFSKGGAIPDSKRPSLLKADLVTLGARREKVNAGETYSIWLEITNVGDTIWLAIPNHMGGFVTVGAHLCRENDGIVAWSYGGGQLANDIRPGERQTVEVFLTAPKDKGIYYVEFDVVCQMICWFAEHGPKTLKESWKWCKVHHPTHIESHPRQSPEHSIQYTPCC
jgi:hypothetical protein